MLAPLTRPRPALCLLRWGPGPQHSTQTQEQRPPKIRCCAAGNASSAPLLAALGSRAGAETSRRVAGVARKGAQQAKIELRPGRRRDRAQRVRRITAAPGTPGAPQGIQPPEVTFEQYRCLISEIGIIIGMAPQYKNEKFPNYKHRIILAVQERRAGRPIPTTLLNGPLPEEAIKAIDSGKSASHVLLIASTPRVPGWRKRKASH